MIELQAIRKDGVYKMKIKDQTITHIRDLTTGCVACSVPSTSRTTSTSTTHAITQPHQHRARAREREKERKRESEKARKREKERGGWVGGGEAGMCKRDRKECGSPSFCSHTFACCVCWFIVFVVRCIMQVRQQASGQEGYLADAVFKHDHVLSCK